jgi:tubulin polyglutamylase TTLL4
MFDINGSQLKSIANMNSYQKISHFPGCWTLGRKDYMWKVLHKMKRKFP